MDRKIMYDKKKQMDAVLNAALTTSDKLQDTLNNVRIDHLIFRLHYLYSSIILFICAVFASTSYIGNAIDCIEDKNLPDKFLNSYCFIHSTYVLTPPPKPTYEPKIFYYDDAHPGVAPLENKTQTINYKNYYMWVCFVLYFQSILFYFPFYVWKCWENGRMKKLVGLLTPPKSEDDKKKDEDEDDSDASDTDTVDGESIENEKIVPVSATTLSVSVLISVQKEERQVQDADTKDGQNKEAAPNESREDRHCASGSDGCHCHYACEHVDMKPWLSCQKTGEDANGARDRIPDKENGGAETCRVVLEVSVKKKKGAKDKDEKDTPAPEDLVKSLVSEIELSLGYMQTYFKDFIFCELLNLINLLGQLYLMDYLLGYEFVSLGMQALTNGILEKDPKERDDVFAKIFPKVAKCYFSKYGPGGNIVNYDGLCVLQLNIINEKIYVFLWFWFIFLLGATILSLVWRLATLVSAKLRIWLILHQFNRDDVLVEERMIIYMFLRNCSAADWFQISLLQDSLLRTTLEHYYFLEIIGRLSTKMTECRKVKTA